jgi:murein DD-endopeptidase MepM/ murein hydrolase activator NlpD
VGRRRFAHSLSFRHSLALVLAVLVIAVPVTAQVTDDDLTKAQAEMDATLAEVQILSAQWEDIVARRETLASQIALLNGQYAETVLQVGELETAAMKRAVELYMTNSLDGIAPFLGGNSISAVGVGISYVNDIVDSDQKVLGDLVAVRSSLDRQRESLDLAEDSLVSIEAELEASVAVINEKLEAAQANFLILQEQKAIEDEARRIAEEEARRAEEEAARKAAEEEAARNATSTTIPAASTTTSTSPTTTTAPGGTTTTTTTIPSSSDGGACPVNGAVSFSDSWGAPRSGGRTHEGVDMLAARGTPIVAIVDGTIKRMRDSTLGGKTIWLRGSNGHEYYYAHLDSHASGLHVGQSVGEGEFIGTVGTSGNAPAHIPHLHFEYHPNGGGAVNPTPLVTSLCR